MRIILVILLSVSCFAKAALTDLQGENLITGQTVSIPTQFKDKKGLVVVFMSAKCPCSNSHVTELKKLSEQYKDFKFTVVHSNSDEPKSMAQTYFKEAGFAFDVIEDVNTKIADQFKALKTPHAFLITPQGEIAYQGGVTNSTHGPTAEKHYLADALENVSQGQKVKVREGRTLGCAITREYEKNVWK